MGVGGKLARLGLRRESRNFSPEYTRDIFLISYPRSGNTWLRSMIGSLLVGADFKNLAEVDYTVPDIHYSVPEARVPKLPFYVVKTHEQLTRRHRSDSIERGIYIIRDPRDVCVSYWRYLSVGEGWSVPFNQFSRDFLSNRIWPGGWVPHVESWTATDKNIISMRYEDISVSPKQYLAQISKFLGVTKDEKELDDVVKRHSKEEMRKMELAGNRPAFATSAQFFIGSESDREIRNAIESSNDWRKFFEINDVLLSAHGYFWQET